jgi:hypothetical protein
MRWGLIAIEGLVTGVAAVVASILLFFVGLSVYSRYVFGPARTGAVGWDVASLFGPHWKLAILVVMGAIFLLGASLAFWFFGHRLHSCREHGPQVQRPA